MKKMLSLFLMFASLQALASTAQDIATAQSLADSQIIVDHNADPSLYRLDDSISRAEILAIALKIKGATLADGYSCKNYYQDVSADLGWICRAVETSADEGLITRKNTIYRPGDTVTRAEWLAILLKAGGKEIQTDCLALDCENTSIDSTVQWHSQVFLTWLSLGIVMPDRVIQDYKITRWTTKYTFRPQDAAKRSEIFAFAQSLLSQKKALEVYMSPETTGSLTPAELASVKADAYIQGAKDAKILFLEYADLECPFCKLMHDADTVVNLEKKYGKDMAFSFKHYPLPFHPLALPAALTAECVGEQGGSDGYYIFLDSLFSESTPTQSNIDTVLDSMKLSNETLRTCVENAKYQKKIEAQTAEGVNLFGINGTPGNVIINTETGKYEVVSGAQPEVNFIEAIERLLK